MISALIHAAVEVIEIIDIGEALLAFGRLRRLSSLDNLSSGRRTTGGACQVRGRESDIRRVRLLWYRAQIMAGKVQRKVHVQLSLESARKPDGRHGGWRPKAGRKRKPGSTSHDTRPEFAACYPQHVTLRVVEDGPNIAAGWLQPHIRAVISESHKPDFRIVEYNVLGNHLHFVAEAAGKKARARGIQGFEVRLAKRLNSVLKRTGKLFADRYHARILTTPTQVRNTLRYVLLNRRHHAPGTYVAKNWIDPCSSGPWFDGWSRPFRVDTRALKRLVDTEAPTRRATTWLLTTGWKKLGLLDFDDCPAS